jgi:hypothetical protein
MNGIAVDDSHVNEKRRMEIVCQQIACARFSGPVLFFNARNI